VGRRVNLSWLAYSKEGKREEHCLSERKSAPGFCLTIGASKFKSLKLKWLVKNQVFWVFSHQSTASHLFTQTWILTIYFNCVFLLFLFCVLTVIKIFSRKNSQLLRLLIFLKHQWRNSFLSYYYVYTNVLRILLPRISNQFNWISIYPYFKMINCNLRNIWQALNDQNNSAIILQSLGCQSRLNTLWVEANPVKRLGLCKFSWVVL